MTCDALLYRLAALLDGELSAEAVAEAERHLLTCTECAQVRADTAKMLGLASVWIVNAPDISGRVLSAVALDDQKLVLEEMQRLRLEMQSLREEVAALRRQLPSRLEAPLWLPPTRRDYQALEDDPWNLIRS